MPVRQPVVEKPKEEVAQPSILIKEIEVPLAVDTAELTTDEIRFTEAELMQMPAETIVDFLKTAYNCNPSEETGRNTNKKVRDIVLRTQELHDKNNKPLPRGDKHIYYKKSDYDFDKAARNIVSQPSPIDRAPDKMPVQPEPLQSLTSIEQRRTVSYEVGATIATQQYENMKVTARIELPVDPTPEEIAAAENTLLIAKDSVFKIINKDIAAIRNGS